MVATPVVRGIPVPLTSFIGRAREVDAVVALLRSDRLVSIVGVGGGGKTRLAVEVTRGAADRFDAGAYFVDLAGCARDASVADVVAAALGLSGESGRPVLARLRERLRPRRALLVLDNCEHVVAACATLVETLLSACPELHVLATSRQPLGVPGETAWRIPPLALPVDGEDPRAADAVRLFEARARAALADVDLDQAATSVAAICRRLDGIPLAIELAAARVAMLPVAVIAEGLDDRLRLLSATARVGSARQRTLRESLAWSHDLLAPAERVLFRRLAVFAGGFTLEACASVCAGDDVDPDDALGLVTGLVEQSLVVPRHREGEARFGLLQTVRAYAREALVEAGEAAVVAQRHLRWAVQRAEELRRDRFVRSTGAAIDALRADLDNFRAALEWSRQHDPETGLRLAWLLEVLWLVGGMRVEGRSWLAALLEAAPDSPPELRFEALRVAGRLAVFNEDPAGARSCFEIAEPIARTLGRRQTAQALHGLAQAAAPLGDLETGRRFLDQALAMFREEVAARRDDAEAANDLRWCLFAAVEQALAEGNLGAAEAHALEGLDVARAAGDTHDVATALQLLAMTAARAGRLQEARALYEEALPGHRGLADANCTARSLVGLGAAALRSGDREAAHAAYVEALRFAFQLEQPDRAAACLEALAGIALEAGQDERAARLLGAAGGGSAAKGLVDAAVDGDTLASQLRRRLGDAFAACWAAGRAMSPDEIARHADAVAEALPADGAPATRARGPAGTAAAADDADNLFRYEGEYWTVRFDHRTVRLRHTKGMAYLGRLLRTPWQEVHALELAAEDRPPPAERPAKAAEGLAAGMGGDEVLDARARAAYRRRIEDLQDSIEEAQRWNDPERAARAQEELDFLMRELTAALGLGGRARRVPDAGERARKAVYNRIRETIAKLEHDHPPLGAHLARAIRTGMLCCYAPERPTTWRH